MYIFSRLPQIFRKPTVAIPGRNGGIAERVESCRRYLDHEARIDDHVDLRCESDTSSWSVKLQECLALILKKPDD